MMQDFVVDTIVTQLERVPGVSEVNAWGGPERQLKIFVDPVRLAEREISIFDLRLAIRARNRDVSGGDLDSGKRRYVIRTLGRFESIAELEDLVIARRSGALTRLRDVGYAEIDHFEQRRFSYTNGEPNIQLGVKRQPGSNVIEILDDVLARVEELNEGVLKRAGIRVRAHGDDVEYVKEAIQTVRQNLMIGAVLAVLVLYLFLRSTSATLIGALGIPVCSISAFFGLLIMGRTINVISLVGVAFAIGMTLDNSIVVLENIYRHLTMGKTRMRAAVDGVREVWTAVLASTLTTVFVFVPIVFVQQEAGQLYSDIAIAISSSILVSMLVAITVVPTACSRFLSTVQAPQTAAPSLAARITERIMKFDEWVIASWSRKISLVVAVLVFTTAIIMILTPKASYLPEGEEKKMFAAMFAPPGYNIEHMHGILKDLEARILPHLGADPGLYHAGQAEMPSVLRTLQFAGASSVFTILETTDYRDADEMVDRLTELLSDTPGMLAFVNRGSIFASNRGGTRSIDLDISGPELAPLFETGFKIFSKSKEIFDNPQVRPDPPSLSLGQPMLEIRPDWERAAELGFTPGELG
jgi:multidrug efflux pump subunit AcrB